MSFSKEWEEWIDLNISLGNSKREIFKKTLEKGYKYDIIKKKLGIGYEDLKSKNVNVNVEESSNNKKSLSLTTLHAIEEHNMIFISAQPDEVFFHWQVEVYLYQFAKQGIADRCYAVFGYNGDGPSEELVNISKKFKNIVWYKDERDKKVKKYYIPSIRPHLLKKFFKEFPALGKTVFYHDSDILIPKLPKFELMLADEFGYLSDTISYIGYDYIKTCGARYAAVYPTLPVDDLFTKMCICLDISEELVKSNELNSGGAQYLLKNLDFVYWEEVENSCVKLYDMLKTYEDTYPIDRHIQSWTTDMWCVLWTYWKKGGKTIVYSELDFSWATCGIDRFLSKNIFHLAGVTKENCSDKFYKATYNSKHLCKAYLKDDTIFDHVSKTSASYGYISIVKEYINKNKDDFIVKVYDKFEVLFGKAHDGVYTKDLDKIVLGKPVWRSTNGYIIFYNSNAWVLTSQQYEAEIGVNCGGFASNGANEPYERGWNMECLITVF